MALCLRQKLKDFCKKDRILSHAAHRLGQRSGKKNGLSLSGVLCYYSFRPTMDTAYSTPCEVAISRDKFFLNFSFIHPNAQLARNKEEEILALMAAFGFEPDIVMISETWHQDNCGVLQPPGYAS